MDDRETPHELLVSSGSATHRLHGLPDLHFYSVAWSPDSEKLATLEGKVDFAARSPLALISPHGPQYSDIVLSVFARSGRPICQSQLEFKAEDVSTRLEWKL
jgi:hypothetical protein